MKTKDVVWTIAGSDPFGAAGLQADLKVAQAFGLHACSLVSAVTAQNSQTFVSLGKVDTSGLEAQWQSLMEVASPAAIKIGLLGDGETCAWLGKKLRDLDDSVTRVCDPVLGSSASGAFERAELSQAYWEHVFPHVHLITPNLPEAESLLNMKLTEESDVIRAAEQFMQRGLKAVLIKGGHVAGDVVKDLYADREGMFWLLGGRVSGDFRGTGCALSQAIACLSTLGHDLRSSAVAARAYVTQAMNEGYQVGEGPRLLGHSDWPPRNKVEGFPRVAPLGTVECDPFPKIDAPGFYPIVDRAAKLDDLISAGVPTCQIRVKDLEGAVLIDEITTAVRKCTNTSTRLFVNDYWRLAIELKAYGVHLGQEDLAEADLPAIQRAGLKLGISTHSYEEAARAHFYRPSYVALGPIFPTTCKSMRFGPQGIPRIKEWTNLLPYPIVAIGGIGIAHAASVQAAGALGIAVISDLENAQSRKKRIQEWMVKSELNLDS
jgi:hydroxymethylpyrimidine kinase/phosphomethylpyrimidine kinase/thiamine-phosphate diphosphorylase